MKNSATASGVRVGFWSSWKSQGTPAPGASLAAGILDLFPCKKMAWSVDGRLYKPSCFGMFEANRYSWIALIHPSYEMFTTVVIYSDN